MEYRLSYKSPLGFLILKSDGESVTGISFSERELQEMDHACTLLLECKKQLEEYFNGKTLEFDLPLSPVGTPFQRKVWEELMKIPKGQTITYHELAIRLGDPKLVRAVGTANGRNPVAIVIPCHRVIGAGNKLTGYAGGLNRKLWLLEHERKHLPVIGRLF
ncbi:MAG TPA: methylated-DNA--[protein]-cysteine S-methyltransferase [Prolixibacteraceae bacterium]|nr:methylated-DNA--[protein]-cysteine S-methyltransferase [Prolixibacteraceae bacterium]